MFVGVGHESSEYLHEARRHRLVLVGIFIPRGNFGWSWCQRGTRGDHSHLQLASKHALTQRIPTVVELTLETFDVRRPNVVRAVHCPGREVRKERPVRVGGTLQANPVDCSLGDVFAHVVVIATFVRHHRCCLIEHRRLVLTGLCTQDSIEALESETGRPPIKRSGKRLFVSRRYVPLSKRTRGIAVLSQDFYERGRFFWDDAVITRKRTCTFGDVTHVHCVVITSREHGGTCR